jgi:hypothetical protein
LLNSFQRENEANHAMIAIPSGFSPQDYLALEYQNIIMNTSRAGNSVIWLDDSEFYGFFFPSSMLSEIQWRL